MVTRPRLILVVEDESSLRELIANILLLDHHEVDTVRDGAEALYRIEQRAYDLIISDLQMPNLDGPGLYAALRKRFGESLPRVILEAMAFGLPVVATSVFGVTEVIDDGGSGYLCRPRDVGELTTALHRALGDDAERRRAIAGAGAERVRVHHDGRRYSAGIAAMLRTLVSDPRALPMTAMEA